MSSRRTTARGTLLLVLALLTLASVAGAAAPPAKLVFPVLGPTTYADDFGDPRAGGPHQGIDMIAAKRSLALAAEAGKVEFWTRSATAGCMLYLHGQSGTDYDYIHLNNDLTAKNDNRGKCVPGVAYAKGLKSGAKVAAGQVVGYVGDSGDANGMHPHLHFEVHPNRKVAVDPYPWLQHATHLLFAAPRGAPFTLELRGTVMSVAADSVQLRVAVVSAWPMRQTQTRLKRTLLVTVPVGATVQQVATLGGPGTPVDLSSARPGQQVDLWTSAAPTTLKAQRGDNGALSASLVSLVGA
ncbi:MAG TPA: M23 family metallopeptidase [Gaiellaceae bacterium]|nr:M23 family metallopeptidase [Gaiellaceae bacterium]